MDSEQPISEARTCQGLGGLWIWSWYSFFIFRLVVMESVEHNCWRYCPMYPVHRQLLFLVLVTATVWWSIWDYFCICLLPAFSFGNVRLLELLAKVQNRFCIPNIRSIFPLSNDIKLHIGSLGSSSDLDLCGHFPKSSNSVFYNLDRTDSFTKVRYLYVYWAMNMETE